MDQNDGKNAEEQIDHFAFPLRRYCGDECQLQDGSLPSRSVSNKASRRTQLYNGTLPMLTQLRHNDALFFTTVASTGMRAAVAG